MKTRHYLVLLLCMFLATAAWGQDLAKRLTNQDVIDMVGLGLSEDVIIAKIRSTSPGALKFDTSRRWIEGTKGCPRAGFRD